MAKRASTVFRCTQCDANYPAWSGKCSACSAWGTLEKFSEGSGGILSQAISAGDPGQTLKLSDVHEGQFRRIPTSIAELDRCLGGGIVPGSVILLGGDPGVGKSTLALQLVQGLEAENLRIVYAAGEESPSQIKLRANRLDPKGFTNLEILPDTNILTIIATAAANKPELLIVDSIQTLYNPESTGVPGSVSQVSGAAAKLVELAKRNNIATLIIGHVTKEGFIAGPKTLEHMVDVVLYLEGERFQQLRILRAVKNRFGGINEVGVFEMAGAGLIEVDNPSRLFLDDQTSDRPGVAMTAISEGSRVIACEIQALLSKSSLAYPKRTAVGFDQNRLWLLLAVLGKYGKLPVYENDVFVNVVGGLKITEPFCDLAIATALVGSLLEVPVSSETALMGEIGLSGEVRPVPQADRRLSELERLGFSRVVIPGRQKIDKTKLEVVRVGDIRELVQKIFGNAALKKSGRSRT